MARVSFNVRKSLALPADAVWQELTAWPRHATWIPATTITLLEGDGGIATRFVARTGVGPLALDDTMVVTHLDPSKRTAGIRKTGPLITGEAGFTVAQVGSGCSLDWWENVEVPHVPRHLAPILALVGRLSFGVAIGRLQRQLRRA